jgi:hypothetical protein
LALLVLDSLAILERQPLGGVIGFEGGIGTDQVTLNLDIVCGGVARVVEGDLESELLPVIFEIDLVGA